ncbi:unnamed protein product [Lactuca virosa]|uniref:Uncharacterized protein n=1 Tax=Lactuca virosa TaxID=75947 RepID=A0AAU9PL03_9ASTR|nr:unnamed protein product [Lactuca virosa]
MAHSTDSDSDFVSTAVPNDESDEEIYVKKRTGDRKYVKGVTKIKEAKRKRNSGDNRATIKKQKTVKEQKTVKDILKELPSINTRSTPGLMTDALIYCDEIECNLQKIERKTPLVTMWTIDKLKERQSFEIEAGGFGVGNLIEQSSNLEHNRMKEMIRKFRDIFSTTLFSSREKSEIIKERTEVKADRDEELNKTNISDFDDDKDEGMNTKLVAFLAVKPLQ